MADDIMGSEIRTPQIEDLPTKGTEKILNIIFVVDTSGSMMDDGRIDAVNDAFVKMIPALRQVQLNCMSEFELRISIMTFDYEAKWIVEPTPIMEYNHEEIQCSKWITYFAKAFEALEEKLSKSKYMAHKGKIAQPYIMLMTDGEPKDDYQIELNSLLENGWFNASQRFAVLIGSEAINSQDARAAVEKFVSNVTEGIINAADAAAIAAEVQAKTLHTVVNMTKHNINIDNESENDKSDTDGKQIDEGDSYDPDWPDLDDFPDFPDIADCDEGEIFL